MLSILEPISKEVGEQETWQGGRNRATWQSRRRRPGRRWRQARAGASFRHGFVGLSSHREQLWSRGGDLQRLGLVITLGWWSLANWTPASAAGNWGPSKRCTLLYHALFPKWSEVKAFRERKWKEVNSRECSSQVIFTKQFLLQGN